VGFPLPQYFHVMLGEVVFLLLECLLLIGKVGFLLLECLWSMTGKVGFVLLECLWMMTGKVGFLLGWPLPARSFCSEEDGDAPWHSRPMNPGFERADRH